MGDVPEQVLRGSTHWIGYGHVGAPLWYVGVEDSVSLARCTKVSDRRQYFDLRRGFDRFEDFVETWEDVFGRSVTSGEGGLSARWWASAFTLAYQGTRLTDLTTEERETTVRDYTYEDAKIGTDDGDTVIASVYPLPKYNIDSIAPYDNVWDDIEDYREDVHPDRLDRFADAIRDSDGVETIVSHAPSDDFSKPIIDRFDGEHEATWPSAGDDTFDAYRLAGDATGVLLVDAPPFTQGHVTYETIQLAAERASNLAAEERFLPNSP